jgi:hypothetical protein
MRELSEPVLGHLKLCEAKIENVLKGGMVPGSL